MLIYTEVFINYVYVCVSPHIHTHTLTEKQAVNIDT